MIERCIEDSRRSSSLPLRQIQLTDGTTEQQIRSSTGNDTHALRSAPVSSVQAPVTSDQAKARRLVPRAAHAVARAQRIPGGGASRREGGLAVGVRPNLTETEHAAQFARFMPALPLRPRWTSAPRAEAAWPFFYRDDAATSAAAQPVPHQLHQGIRALKSPLHFPLMHDEKGIAIPPVAPRRPRPEGRMRPGEPALFASPGR